MAPTRRATIHDGPLPAAALSPAELSGPAYGALASFIGVVRDHARGRRVVDLDYACYRPMAAKVLDDLIAEAARDHDPDLAALITHGIGPMRPGDASVAIHVGAAHRAAAFAACRQIIERLKQDVPIWKHERYDDGEVVWLQGS